MYSAWLFYGLVIVGGAMSTRTFSHYTCLSIMYRPIKPGLASYFFVNKRELTLQCITCRLSNEHIQGQSEPLANQANQFHTRTKCCHLNYLYLKSVCDDDDESCFDSYFSHFLNHSELFRVQCFQFSLKFQWVYFLVSLFRSYQNGFFSSSNLKHSSNSNHNFQMKNLLMNCFQMMMSKRSIFSMCLPRNCYCQLIIELKTVNCRWFALTVFETMYVRVSGNIQFQFEPTNKRKKKKNNKRNWKELAVPGTRANSLNNKNWNNTYTRKSSMTRQHLLHTYIFSNCMHHEHSFEMWGKQFNNIASM